MKRASSGVRSPVKRLHAWSKAVIAAEPVWHPDADAARDALRVLEEMKKLRDELAFFERKMRELGEAMAGTTFDATGKDILVLCDAAVNTLDR